MKEVFERTGRAGPCGYPGEYGGDIRMWRHPPEEVVVVDNVDNAVGCPQISSQPPYGDAGGEAFNPGGSISGGAYKNNSNLLGKTRREMAG